MSELVNVFPSQQPNSSYLRGIETSMPAKVCNSMKYNCVYELL